ncbi:MAG: helix-turn-helix transcriptional regulator [Armatimonadota bacterium]
MSKLREKRETLGFNYTQMAEATGITRQHYAYIENGDRLPSLPVALAIARALDSTIEELFGNVPLPDTTPQDAPADSPEVA